MRVERLDDEAMVAKVREEESLETSADAGAALVAFNLLGKGGPANTSKIVEELILGL